jgi:hypothetical protein
MCGLWCTGMPPCCAGAHQSLGLSLSLGRGVIGGPGVLGSWDGDDAHPLNFQLLSLNRLVCTATPKKDAKKSFQHVIDEMNRWTVLYISIFPTFRSYYGAYYGLRSIDPTLISAVLTTWLAQRVSWKVLEMRPGLWDPRFQHIPSVAWNPIARSCHCPVCTYFGWIKTYMNNAWEDHRSNTSTSWKNLATGVLKQLYKCPVHCFVFRTSLKPMVFAHHFPLW